MKLKIHPLFFVTGFIYLLLGQFSLVIACFIAVILHELAHTAAARRRGVVFDEITLMPYGAVVKGGNFAHLGRRGLAVAFAGPCFNLAAFIILSSLWWFFPATYAFTADIAFINLSLGLFNLLPIPPLDGSKIVLIFAKRKLRAMKVMRILGLISGVLLLTAGIFLAVNLSFNVSFFVMSVFLLYGSLYGTEDEALSYALGTAMQRARLDI